MRNKSDTINKITKVLVIDERAKCALHLCEGINIKINKILLFSSSLDSIFLVVGNLTRWLRKLSYQSSKSKVKTG